MSTYTLNKKELRNTLKKIGIHFHDMNYLIIALSHRSYANELGIAENNEKLEFLGDSILGFVITEYLFVNFPEYNEGELAKIKSFVISENTLTTISKKIGLNKFILIGKGEESSGGRNKKTIIADAFEAFLGGYYLDSNLKNVKKVIIRLFRDEIDLVVKDKHEKDYKTLLQELAQKKYKVCPTYRLKSKEGPEHDRIFYMEVLINNVIFGLGQGKSKKEAEKVAAKNAYFKITSPHLQTEPRKTKRTKL